MRWVVSEKDTLLDKSPITVANVALATKSWDQSHNGEEVRTSLIEADDADSLAVSSGMTANRRAETVAHRLRAAAVIDTAGPPRHTH